MSAYGILAIAVLAGGQTTKPARGVPVFEGASAPVVKIAVRPSSDVSGKTFTIGDIAQVTGTNKALITQVAAVEAGASPLPGLTRTIDRRDILPRLRARGIDTAIVEVTCPSGARVARASVEVPNADIVRAATDTVALLPNAASGEMTVEALPLTSRLFVSPGKLEYRAGTPHGQMTGGMVTVPVTVLVDGRPAKSLDVMLKVHRSIMAVVAARTLAPHETLTAADVSTTSIEVTSSSQHFVTDLAAVVGKRTTRQIMLGSPMMASAIESAPVIVTGAKVTVEIVVGGVKICAPAVARAPGAIGDRIRCFALDTRKELTGIVVDVDTVRVEELQ